MAALLQIFLATFADFTSGEEQWLSNTGDSGHLSSFRSTGVDGKGPSSLYSDEEKV